MPERDPEPDCCLPGDITITALPRGFRVGRAIQGPSVGLWWEYIQNVSSFEIAVQKAQEWARAENARVWVDEDGVHRRLRDDEALPQSRAK